MNMRSLLSLLVYATLSLATDLVQVAWSTSGTSILGGNRLVQLSGNPADRRWLSVEERRALKLAGGFFKDVTDYPDTRSATIPLVPSYPEPSSTLVKHVIANLSTANAEAYITRLTSFFTRWCETDTGRDAAAYILDTLQSFTAAAPIVLDRKVTITPVQHAFKQFSIVVRIAPPDALSTDAVAIVGAHIDSANRYNESDRAPGADDDGSGTATLLEAARVLLGSRYTPTAPVELHFYAGEEAGLLGSQDIAHRYHQRGVQVKGMLQFDMTAWVADKEHEHIGITVSRSRELAKFNEKLVDRYLSIPWIEESTYPWGASDSASWGDLNYPSSDALEGTWLETRGHGNDNQYHAQYSFSHMMEFSKLAVAFLIELGGGE